MNRSVFLTTAAAVALVYGMAPAMLAAQEDEAQQQDTTEQQEQLENEEAAAEAEEDQVARACLEDLQGTVQAMAQEGYWITGWGQRWGWGTGEPGMTQPPQDPAATGAVPEEQVQDPDTPATTATDPWGLGARHGAASPRHQIRALHSAAHVLAYQGDEEGCQYLVDRLQRTAEGHLTDLREMGVEPDEVVDWRREAMAGAVPVAELEARGLYVDDLTGVDVRNLQDEYLGSVADVVMDAEQGDPEYLVVARGGFLGIGEDHVLVPWDELSAAPELNVLILDVPEAAFEQAPAVDPDVAMDAEWMQDYRQETDTYWQQQREG